MDKIETYEPTEESFEYQPFEYQPKESSLLKTIFLCIGMIVLGCGLAFIVVVTGMSPQFLTDQDCFALQNESFINGTLMGTEYLIATITNELVQCKTLPISYAGYNYTIVAIECLNLNNTGGQ